MTARLALETHCHTYWSTDCLMLPAQQIAAALAAGLDRLAITDHNLIGGAVELARLAPDLILIGEEIKTSQGELLAYYVKELVPSGLSPEETIRRLPRPGRGRSQSPIPSTTSAPAPGARRTCGASFRWSTLSRFSMPAASCAMPTHWRRVRRRHGQARQRRVGCPFLS